MTGSLLLDRLNKVLYAPLDLIRIGEEHWHKRLRDSRARWKIKTALRTSFPLLDVDIDRKKDGAEMGLHEHFLGEAHAIH